MCENSSKKEANYKQNSLKNCIHEITYHRGGGSIVYSPFPLSPLYLELVFTAMIYRLSET